MAILVSDLISRMQSALDSTQFDRYTFDEDFKPAINYAQEWLISLYNAVFATKKISEENLRELIEVGVWQTSNNSRVSFDVPNHNLWSIIAIYPKITAKKGSITYAVGSSIDSPSSSSIYYNDVAYIKSYKSAKRLSMEEFNLNRTNPFEAGNEQITATDLIDYAYMNFAEYSHVDEAYPLTSSARFEAEISPSVANELIAIAYLKKPTEITLETDYIQFPEVLMNMMLNKSLNFISYKIGDRTTLDGVTNEDVKNLIALST